MWTALAFVAWTLFCVYPVAFIRIVGPLFVLAAIVEPLLGDMWDR